MELTEVIANIKPSIALILVLDRNNTLMGTGSGFVYEKKGILVTCNHVVKDAGSVFLKFSDSDKPLSAKVVIQDDEHDLALLKFEDESRVPLQISPQNPIKEGMNVIFSGYPLSLQDLTTHQGIISSISKDAVGLTTYLIDGTVNSGNSGCPLMDTAGNVLAVVNAKSRVRNELLSEVEKMKIGALSLHGIDLVEIYQAIIKNVQLGIGYAVPATYIPAHKEIDIKKPGNAQELTTAQNG